MSELAIIISIPEIMVSDPVNKIRHHDFVWTNFYSEISVTGLLTGGFAKYVELFVNMEDYTN